MHHDDDGEPSMQGQHSWAIGINIIITIIMIMIMTIMIISQRMIRALMIQRLLPFLSGRHQSQTQIMHPQQQRLVRSTHHKRKNAKRAKENKHITKLQSPTKEGTTLKLQSLIICAFKFCAEDCKRMRDGLR